MRRFDFASIIVQVQYPRDVTDRGHALEHQPYGANLKLTCEAPTQPSQPLWFSCRGSGIRGKRKALKPGSLCPQLGRDPCLEGEVSKPGQPEGSNHSIPIPHMVEGGAVSIANCTGNKEERTHV